MNEPSKIIKELLCNIENNSENAKTEIKNHTLNFLQRHKSDNLLELIQNASKRGYSGTEWIDFWGVGGMNSDVIIKWAYSIIKEQKIESIIEPYYNNINHRLGILIKRCYVKGKPKFLPMELQNKHKHKTVILIPPTPTPPSTPVSQISNTNIDTNTETDTETDTETETDTVRVISTVEHALNIAETLAANPVVNPVVSLSTKSNIIDSHFKRTANENQEFVLIKNKENIQNTPYRPEKN